MTPFDWPRSVAPAVNEPQPYSVGIVVPVKDGLKFFKLCFHSVLDFADHPYTLTVVDNQSSLKAKDYFRIQQHNHPISVLRYDDDFNFAAEVNLGLRHAFRSPEVKFGMVLQADTVASPEFLSALVREFAAEEKLGVAAPKTNDARPGASNACLIFRRRVFEDLGGFDESYIGGGYECDDFRRRAEAAGWRIGYVEASYVHHFVAAFRRWPVDAATDAANRVRFFEKHKVSVPKEDT